MQWMNVAASDTLEPYMNIGLFGEQQGHFKSTQSLERGKRTDFMGFSVLEVTIGRAPLSC